MIDYLNVEWTRDIVVQLLKEGNTITCYGCPDELKHGDQCALFEGKVFCLDCADGEGEILFKEGEMTNANG